MLYYFTDFVIDLTRFSMVLVDGMWSSWTEWSSCSLQANSIDCSGTDKLVRNRTCTDPAPNIGGDYCPGANVTTTDVGK